MKTRGFYKLTGIAIILILIISGLMHDHSIVAAQQNMDKIEGRLLEQFSTQDSADFIAVTRQDSLCLKIQACCGSLVDDPVQMYLLMHPPNSIQ